MHAVLSVALSRSARPQRRTVARVLLSPQFVRLLFFFFQAEDGIRDVGLPERHPVVVARLLHRADDVVQCARRRARPLSLEQTVDAGDLDEAHGDLTMLAVTDLGE